MIWQCRICGCSHSNAVKFPSPFCFIRWCLGLGTTRNPFSPPTKFRNRMHMGSDVFHNHLMTISSGDLHLLMWMSEIASHTNVSKKFITRSNHCPHSGSKPITLSRSILGPSWCVRASSFGMIGWYATSAPKDITRPSKETLNRC